MSSTSSGTRRRRTVEDKADDAIKGVGDTYLRNARRFSDKALSQSGANGPGAIFGSPIPGTAFLPTAGGTMIGSIAYNPVAVQIDDGRINIEPDQDDASKASSYVLTAGMASPDDLHFVDGADKNGQMLFLQGTESQVINIIHANLVNIQSISGLGTVTVVTTVPHNLVTGAMINILGTDNFNATNVSITVTNPTTFTYTAIGNIVGENSGLVQDGNIVTPDGQDITLDGTIAPNGVPIVTLIFDPTIEGFGAWRVVSVSNGGSGGISFPILYPEENLGNQGLATVNIDISGNTGQFKEMTLTGDIGLAFNNPPAATVLEEFWIIINQNGVGGWSITSTPTALKNGGILDSLLDKAIDAQTTFHFVTGDGGVTYHGELVDLTSGGSSNVPDGTVINDHLEWDGAAWVAQQFMEFGTATVNNPATGKLRFGNNQFQSWFNAAETETYLFGVGANDFLNIIGTKLDMNSEDIVAVDRLGFSQFSEAPATPTDEVIYLDANGDMTFNVDTGSGFRWDFLNVNKALLTEVGGTPDPAFILFGSNNEIPTMRVNRIDSTPVTGPAGTVGKVEWWGVDSSGVTLEEYGRIEVEAADLTIGSVSGAMNLRVERNDNSTVFMTLNDSDDDKITIWKNLFFQTAIDAELNDNDLWLDNGLNTKLSGTQTGFNVTVDSTFVATFGSNSLVMQPDKDITTRAVLHTPTDAVFTTNGQIWYDLSENKFKGRENGVTVDLVGGAGSGANTFLSNLTSPTAINESLLPVPTGDLHLGGSSNIWDDLFTEEVRFFTGGVIGSRNGIMTDAGGMVYLTEDMLTHEFFVNGQTSVEIAENEINFTDSGRQHQIIANASNFQFITENTSDGMEIWTGASRSNATVNIEDGVTEFLTNDTSLNPYRLQIIQNNDTPATQRVIGSLDGLAENTSSADIIYGRIEFSTADSVTAGSENGRVGIEVRSDGANVPVITVAGDGGSAGGELAFFSLATVPQQSVASDTLANLYTALRNYKLIA